ncbi:hypothetical protein [Vibrio hyugaensis]|uniref:hypothetical protein n=1 Tax=Vibrio hyugaensis TaxID=1534743 RepID=UPI0005F09685|nr:hypothetical protein [Vibrio hyugaensis]
MEELVIGAARVLGTLIRWLMIELLLDRVVYSVGYAGLYILTLGKRPRRPVSQEMKGRIVLLGIALSILIFALLICL